jgi:4-diphosphocytidyl-2C-methyl-D-erythritol kinase
VAKIYKEEIKMRITEILTEDWQKTNRKDKTSGMSKKAVKAYRRENPGSKLQTAVTTKPSKLKKGSKSAKRRKSFCARMSGMKKSRTSAKTKRDPNSNINKALRRWNCESIIDMRDLLMLAEHTLRELKRRQ